MPYLDHWKRLFKAMRISRKELPKFIRNCYKASKLSGNSNNKSIKAIAFLLSICQNTVRKHIRNH